MPLRLGIQSLEDQREQAILLYPSDLDYIAAFFCVSLLLRK